MDLPTRRERREIFALHLKKRLNNDYIGSRITVDEALLDRLAVKTEGFVGAEIEQAVVAALYEAFFHQRPLLEEDLNYAIDSTVPLSVTQAESIRALRQWANVRAVAATAREDLENYEKSDPEEPETDIRKSRGGRSLDF